MDKVTKEEKTQKEAPEASEIRTPESEVSLATIAIPLGETVLKIQGDDGLIMYGILQRSRASTVQSDFFQLQVRGYALNQSANWSNFSEEESQFHATRNCAWARVDHPSRAVTFGPKAGINITTSLAGTGLDDFLFAAVIAWAKQAYPDYAASPGMMTLPANINETDKLARQSFFAKQGFEFEWKDDHQRSGMYYKDRIGRLIGVSECKLIAEFGGESMLQSLIRQDQERLELEQKLAKVETLNNMVHQALDKERHTTQALTVALIIVLLIGLWAVL